MKFNRCRFQTLPQYRPPVLRHTLPLMTRMPTGTRSRVCTPPSATENGRGNRYSVTEEMGEFCAPAYVQWSNEDGRTKLRVQLVDYPGLLRVIAWVLNGMDVRVHSAKLTVTDDGMVDDIFYVTTRSGKPLSDNRAKMLAEQLQDFAMYCSKPPASSSMEWQNGPVFVSNASHPKYSEVTVLESGVRPGFLLEIASVMSGVGIEVREADIRTCTECHADHAVPHLLRVVDESVRVGRVIKLLVRDPAGGKLTETSVNTVLYTLGLLTGQGHAPTVVPTLTSYAVRETANATE